MEFIIQWVKQWQIMSDSDNCHKENKTRRCDKENDCGSERKPHGMGCSVEDSVRCMIRRVSVLSGEKVKGKGPEAGKASVAGL